MKFHRILVGATSLILASAVSHAAQFTYSAILNGPNEPTTSPGTGFATAVFDSTAHTLLVSANFANLVPTTALGLPSGTTAAHIHAPTSIAGTGTAGVATTTPTFPNFPLGVTAGSFSVQLDLTSASAFNPAFVTAQGGLAPAEATLVASLAGGTSYFNIHSTAFPGGEIRGFLVPTGVPDGGASTLSLLLLGLSALAVVGRHLRRDAS